MTFMELFRKKSVNALPLGWYKDYYCYHNYYIPLVYLFFYDDDDSVVFNKEQKMYICKVFLC